MSILSISLLALIVLYLWFRSAMWYLRNKHRIRERVGVGVDLLVVALVPGLLLDVIINWTIGIPLLGLVWCWTLSQKLAYVRSPKWKGYTWRLRLADWACESLLNKWDPTHHHC
jgi:hypothetical protein